MQDGTGNGESEYVQGLVITLTTKGTKAHEGKPNAC